ncbi:MAG: ABC transporter ATP-binding protein [Alcaligenaceae bacterium]|nr:ABC transporter ATP-binding protein [Alcaligenaceae bacterium]
MPIQFDHVNFRYGQSHNGLTDINLTIEDGEFLAVIGPSGSGKSTLLTMLSGFNQPQSGRILLNGKDITHEAPENRELGIVFQSYGLFPHMTALQNVAYPLKIRGVNKKQRLEMAQSALEKVSLAQWMNHMPANMSGGQQQRVALARALVFNPKALLLDEPLSALDAALRVEMREQILSVQRAANIATLHVTHDQEEALSIADRIAVMKDGKIEQLDSPQNLYDRPVNRWVASFIGQTNLIECTVSEQRNHIKTPMGLLRCDTENLSAGTPMVAMIRPESILPGHHPSEHHTLLEGEVLSDRFLGATRRLDLKIVSHILQVDTLSREPFTRITIPARAIHLLH